MICDQVYFDPNYPIFKADPKHGEEIIEVLETLGGFNKYKWNGNGSSGYYGIREGIINHVSNRSYSDIERAIDIQEFLKFK